jgi:hypothetical protein
MPGPSHAPYSHRPHTPPSNTPDNEPLNDRFARLTTQASAECMGDISRIAEIGLRAAALAQEAANPPPRSPSPPPPNKTWSAAEIAYERACMDNNQGERGIWTNEEFAAIEAAVDKMV